MLRKIPMHFLKILMIAQFNVISKVENGEDDGHAVLAFSAEVLALSKKMAISANLIFVPILRKHSERLSKEVNSVA